MPNNMAIWWVCVWTFSFLLIEFSKAYVGPYRSWTKSNATLTTTVRNPYIAYNETYDSNIIWIVGGYYDCAKCVQKYEIESDTLTLYDDSGITASRWSEVERNCFMLGSDIYYIHYSGTIYKYNIPSKTETSCVIHPNNIIFSFLNIKVTKC